MASEHRKCIKYASRNLVPVHLDHVLEFGVCTGSSMKIIRAELDRNNYQHEVFGFDSFVGLPEAWEGTGLEKGYFSTKGNIPDIDRVKFFKGWFTETIPEYLKIAKPIALLHIDCDLYSSTLDVLYGVQDFIVKDTIIVFDDWFYNRDPKCNDSNQKAFYEWVDDYKCNYRFIDFPGSGDPTVGRKVLEVI
jgi:hypothetical protein